jgi:exosortase
MATADLRPDPNSSTALKMLRPSGFAIGFLVAVLVWSYWDSLSHLAHRWSHESDYTHGPFVPLFAAFLLWFRRSMLPAGPVQGSWWGVLPLALAGAMKLGSIYFFYTLMDAASLLPCLAGVVLLVAGWRGLHWSWPAIAFLVFMIPLPGAVSGMLSHPLQRSATLASTYALQTLGVPAIARGNVIWLTEARIGVVEACNGLPMMMMFFAITLGAALLVRRPLWEKVLITLSAIAIGLVANLIRITVTAFLHEYVGSELADRVFHDLAGWLMMPLATVILGLEMYVLSKLLVVPERVDVVLAPRSASQPPSRKRSDKQVPAASI